MVSSARIITTSVLGLMLIGVGSAQQGPPLDRGKNKVIERPVVDVVKNAAPARQPRLDVGKSMVIEPNIEALLAAARTPAAPAAPAFVNPKVEPGKVRWHKSLADAQAASLRSKKPVLVFQLMGKLDDQFC